jgi:hypothetical protein
MCFHLLVSFDLVTNRSNPKINIADLNYALEHNEKLEHLPDTIETNVIYRLSLASNTKGEFRPLNGSIKYMFCIFRCL